MLCLGRRALVLAVTSVAFAGNAADVHAVDIELGRYLASECMACHGAATASSTIPNIFGLAEQSIREALSAYRDKRLPNPAMQNVASRLSDEDIAALAGYLTTMKKP